MWKLLANFIIILQLSVSSASVDSIREVGLECQTHSEYSDENHCWLTDLSSPQDQVIVTKSSFNIEEQLKLQQPVNVFIRGNESYPEYFPRNLTKFVSGVTGFLYDHTPLKYIKREDLKDLASPNELLLHLRNNQIEEIPFDTFYDLPMLLYLDISSNKIKSLASNLLTNSLALHSLIVSSNELTELHQDLFINCPKIYDLTAEFNEIEEIHADLFKNNPNMASISMQYNKIRNILVDFRKLKLLEFADFTNNYGTCDVMFSIQPPDEKDFDENEQKKWIRIVPKFQKKIEKICRE